ncbi:uncharacterized protein LOC118802695 isoform X2 [Colossoma macropomum]|uniref:uncharacterized protein LOC118802695 isoform X2 n=1 Tax=Colossoma macropomum TaxID=42526 RepID=UPI001864ABE4|nr:uncharacterized protein LOC118802695 isoform X2 [Colossoma macropomum]
MAKRLIRQKQLSPQQDAEIYIKMKTDKPGLEEKFISSFKGRGVFSTANFCKGDFVLEYRGQLLTQNLTQKNISETVFIFDFQWRGKYWSVDASVEDKSLGRLVNDEHKKPNCKIKVVEVDGTPHLCLFALRDISPGEEITYNYGDSDWPWRKQVKPEASTVRAHQKLLITTGDEVKETLPKSYSLKCTETKLTAEKVQERSESLRIIESEEQAEPSVSCIQKKPETDWSSCPVEEEASSQHKPSDAGDDLVRTKHVKSHFVRNKQTISSRQPKGRVKSFKECVGITESEEQAEPSVSCIPKKPETDWSSCPVEEEASSQHKPLDAGGDLVQTELSERKLMKPKQTISTSQRAQEMVKPPTKSFGIRESEEEAEPSVSCIPKKPETDWSSCPVEEEASSQHKPLDAGGDLVRTKHVKSHFVRNKQTISSRQPKGRVKSFKECVGITESEEQAEPSVSCIPKKPETDWSSCPVEEEASSQHKPLDAGGDLVQTELSERKLMKPKQTISTSQRAQEMVKPPTKSFGIRESEEEAEPSVSCIQKKPETDWSSYPVEEEASSQHKPLDAGGDLVQTELSERKLMKPKQTISTSQRAQEMVKPPTKSFGIRESEEEAEPSVSCIPKKPETDWSSCPVEEEASSQHKPLDAGGDLSGTAQPVQSTNMKQNALEKQRKMLCTLKQELSREISKIDKLLDISSPGAHSPDSNSSLSDEDVEEKISSPPPGKSSSRKRSGSKTDYEPRKRQTIGSSSDDSPEESGNTDCSDVDYIPGTDESSSDQSGRSLQPIAKKPLLVQRFSISSSKQDNTESTQNLTENSSNMYVLPPSNLKAQRVYDKRNFCAFCFKPSSKIARHLEIVHRSEVEVAQAVQYPKGSKARRTRLNVLRNRGNFVHNAEVVRRGTGQLVACYRPREQRDAKDFIHCAHCQGLYSKRTLWRHMKNCPKKTQDSDESPIARKRVRSLCALATPVGRDISEGLKKVLSQMTYDDVYHTVQNDKCILQFGEHMFNRHGSDVSKHDYIRQKMREVGRLLLEAQKLTPLKKMEDFIIPANFSHVVSAVKVVAGYNPEKNTYSIPSLALKLGHSLQKICSIVESNAMICGNQTMAEQAKNFRIIHQARWNEFISAGAITTLKEAKWNVPQILPFTEDVKLLNAHLEKKQDEYEKQLRTIPTADSYASLAKVTLALAIIFNRRRAGEVSRMDMSAFMSRNNAELHEDIALCLPKFEQKMCQFFSRVEFRGKRGRMVAVLLKPSMVASLKLLAESREKCGVPKENPFMFARPGAMSAYRGAECLRKFANECGAKHPQALTSTKLRKHIATMSQVLNLEENEADQLADFLGHDIRIHRQYYRLPQGTLQLAKMSKVLMAMERGMLSEFKGKSLDEIEIHPDENLVHSECELSSDDDEDEPTDTVAAESIKPAVPATDPDSTASSIAPITPKQPDATRKPKRKWEDSEVRAVERHLIRFIQTGKVPQKRECIQCLLAESHVLRERSWTDVKNFVRNRSITLKKQFSTSLV